MSLLAGLWSLRRRGRAEEHTRAWVHDLVRSGLVDDAELHAQVSEAVRQDLPWRDTAATVEAWVREARRDWRRDAATWAETTDHDRLQRAFARLEAAGVAVLQGCVDHWAARALLDERGGELRGVVWFVPADVWHAIDAGMLEVNLWHADGANAAPGDGLLDEVLGVLADEGLPAHFDEGRIEVRAFWQHRPPAPGTPGAGE